MNDTRNSYRTLTKCEAGKLSKVIEYGSGAKVEIPINSDGSVKWFDDNKLLKDRRTKAEKM
jgi:hypothetical protein